MHFVPYAISFYSALDEVKLVVDDVKMPDETFKAFHIFEIENV